MASGGIFSRACVWQRVANKGACLWSTIRKTFRRRLTELSLDALTVHEARVKLMWALNCPCGAKWPLQGTRGSCLCSWYVGGLLGPLVLHIFVSQSDYQDVKRKNRGCPVRVVQTELLLNTLPWWWNAECGWASDFLLQCVCVPLVAWQTRMRQLVSEFGDCLQGGIQRSSTTTPQRPRHG